MREPKVTAPVYSQIALDVAMRIARGDLKENTRLFGRSVMSSEYGVSPETIRRAMRLLEDMGIVGIRQNSGSTVLSAEKASVYVERFGEHNSVRSMRRRMMDLIEEQEIRNRQIGELASSIARINERSTDTNPFSNHEEKVPEGSPVIGKNLTELHFWQQTGATIIAIRREDQIILSPGPYAVLQYNDTLIFVGDLPCVQTVREYLSQPV